MSATEGTLRVSVASRSMFLADRLPIEIRDARHALVQVITANESVVLQEGLYSVTAVLERGERVTQHTHVVAGREVGVAFDPAAGPGDWVFGVNSTGALRVDTRSDVHLMSDRWWEASPGANPDAAGHTLDGYSFYVAAPPAIEVDALGSQFLKVRLREAGTVPWIRIDWDRGSSLFVALPLSTHDGCDVCSVELLTRTQFDHLDVAVHLAPERRVAGTLGGLMASGKIGLGLELAGDAAEALAHKYSDPIWAAYGGLVLHRFGLLAERADWVENLARDFAWLPDGRILLAALLAQDAGEAERRRGLELLLDATRERTLVFGDAFSLALRLLREWPDGERAEPRRQRLAQLAPTTARFDFTATLATLRWSYAAAGSTVL